MALALTVFPHSGQGSTLGAVFGCAGVSTTGCSETVGSRTGCGSICGVVVTGGCASGCWDCTGTCSGWTFNEALSCATGAPQWGQLTALGLIILPHSGRL